MEVTVYEDPACSWCWAFQPVSTILEYEFRDLVAIRHAMARIGAHHPVLIDAGTGLAPHLEAIAEAQPEGPGHVVVTHAHGDHASGAPALRERWANTTFSKFPWPGRDDRYPADWTFLRDGDVIPAGKMRQA